MPKALWSGSINFGLVHIPVRLFAATKDRRVRFHRMSQDGQSRLRQKLYCPQTGEEFEADETVRGYEVAPDQYVTVSDDELERFLPDATRTLDIVSFVDPCEIDPLYFDTAYVLLPDRNAYRSYSLLRDALQKMEKVGIGRIVMRNRQHLCVLRPAGAMIYVQTLRYHDEIVRPEDLDEMLPHVHLDHREAEMAERLIGSLTDQFEPHQHHDEYRDRLLEYLERKHRGAAVSLVGESATSISEETVDLLAALERSLAAIESARPHTTNR